MHSLLPWENCKYTVHIYSGKRVDVKGYAVETTVLGSLIGSVHPHNLQAVAIFHVPQCWKL